MDFETPHFSPEREISPTPKQPEHPEANREPESTAETKPESSQEEAEGNDESASEIVLVPYDSLPVAEQQKITDRVVDAMRRVLRDIPDYVLFASTAVYLQGKRMRALKDPNADAFLKTAPGDLDIAVASMESLRKIQERMANMPGVYFDNGGKLKKLPGEENQVLAGSMIVRVENAQGIPHDVKYDFEFFNEKRIVTDDAFKRRVQIEGVNVLSREGLKTQYLNNLSLETKVDKNVRDTVGYLTGEMLRNAQQAERELAQKQGREPEALALPEGWVDPEQVQSEVMSGKVGPEVAQLLDRMGLKQESVKTFYEVQKKIDEETDEKKRQELITQRSTLLSAPGLKTKIPKREASIEKLQRAQQIEL